MDHSKDCTAGSAWAILEHASGIDIDPTCEACIQQRLDRSRGYPPILKSSRCPRCGGKLEKFLETGWASPGWRQPKLQKGDKPGATRCPHGNCEHGWPAPDAEGRQDTGQDDYPENEGSTTQARAGVTPLGQCIAEQNWDQPDLREWDDYADDMGKLPPWNEGIK